MEVIHIKPPLVLLQPLNIPQKLLMGPGPSNCSPKVLRALSEQMLGHMDEDFLKIMNEVKLGIKYAFQTNNEMTFPVSGTGHCAMETAICNVVEPNDTFLVASTGIWGDRAFNIGQRIGAKCHQIKTTDADIIHLDKFKAAVVEWNPKVIFICHGDSSTGVLQPLEDIANFLKGFACLLIVDCVASLGAVPIFMDKWGIDVLYSGSQKVLSAPPGLSPISFSQKAVEKLKSRKTPVTSFYLDALALGNYWQCDKKPIVYHHTAPISLVYALREALSILTLETLENCWKRHKLCAEKLHQALEEMGLILFVPNKTHRLPSVTTVEIPAGVNGPFVIKAMKEKFNIDIAGGLGTTANKVWRIGLMGHNCTDNNVNRIISSLKKCIDLNNLKSSL